MDVLNWVAEHYVITIILAAIAAQGLIGFGVAIGGRR